MFQSLALIAGAVAPAFEPSDIPGLAGWWRGDTLITSGSNLTSWTDKSGNGRTLTTSGGAPQVQSANLNGEDTVLYDGDADVTETAVFTFNRPWSIFLVMNPVQVINPDRVLNWGGDDRLIMRGGEIDLYDNEAQVVSDNVWYLFNASSDTGGNTHYRLDTTNDQPGGSGTAATEPMILGAQSGGGDYANIDVAELVLYDTEIEGADRTNIETYFKDRYNLPGY